MTSEAETKFLKEFGPRRDAMLGRLAEAAGVNKPKPMSLGDLEVLAAASMELLTTALANMPIRFENGVAEIVRNYFGDVFITLNFDFPSHMRSPLVPRVYVCLSRFLIARVS
jgi:hypothetical protein